MFLCISEPVSLIGDDSVFVALLVLLSYYLKPLREGVVFTPYDNEKYFVKPWDQFCVQTPPSCKKENINYLEEEKFQQNRQI